MKTVELRPTNNFDETRTTILRFHRKYAAEIITDIVSDLTAGAKVCKLVLTDDDGNFYAFQVSEKE
jgi:hypothetical protein